MRLHPLVRDRRVQLAAAGLVVLVLAGYGTYLAVRPYDLQRDDPDGWIACAGLKQWLDGDARDLRGQPYPLSLVTEAAGSRARQSEHPAIREAAHRDPAGHWIADPEQLRAACRSIGYAMPDGHW